MFLALPLGQLLYQSGDAGRYMRLFAPTALMLYLDCIVDGMHKGLGQQVYCVRVNTFTSVLDVGLLVFAAASLWNCRVLRQLSHFPRSSTFI